MDERMTLEQVRDQIHAFATAKDRNGTAANYYVEMNVLVMDEWWKAIDSHLAQPAQAVDVRAIREVIAELRAGAEISRTSSSRTQTDKNVAGYLDRQADKLTRAISAAPPSNSPTTGAIGESGNG